MSATRDNDEITQENTELRHALERLQQELESKTRELRTANRVLREDLIRHQQLEHRLRESEQQLREIVEHLPIALAISRSADGRLLYVNQLMGDLAGVPAEQMVGRLSSDFYHDPADRELILSLLEADKEVNNFELRVRPADGSPMWVVSSVQLIRYQGEDAILCACIDVTSRKQAEISLRKEQRLQQRLLDTHQRERQLTAFEIHDGMVQDMTAALMLLESTRAALPDSEEKTDDNFERALGMVRHAIDEARRLIEGLAPPVLEAEGILPALNSLVDEMAAKSDMTVKVAADLNGRRLAPALEMSVFRIVQESLNNAWRHGQSKLAIVRIKQHGEMVRVVVRDFGNGFEVSQVSATRYGLRGIRERARLLGGRARIVSVPGKGTLVIAELPVIEVRPMGDRTLA